MTTSYFLFGKQATECLLNEDIDSLCNQLDDFEYQLFVYDETKTPADLLYAYDGWGGYSYLTKEEYDKIIDTENSLTL